MHTYEVTIERTGYATYIVEALNEEHAADMVWHQYKPEDTDKDASALISNIEELE